MEELKSKWGGSLPQMGDWGQSLCHPHKFTDHNSLPSSWEAFDPIPLTPEVLEKIEEVRTEDGKVHPYLQIDKLRAIHFGGGDLYLGWCGKISIITLIKGPTYLHQLQQAVRMIGKGKEITYTP